MLQPGRADQPKRRCSDGARRQPDGSLGSQRRRRLLHRPAADGTITWAGLHNSGFHRGTAFTNVFQGTRSPDGSTTAGEWADVPRGENNGGGELDLEVSLTDSGQPQLKQISSPVRSGFGATWWERAAPLADQDIVNITSRVYRYDGIVGDKNPPCRDFTVMWGQVSNFHGPVYPPEHTYCSFLNSSWVGDGDFDFDLTPDLSRSEADFWTDGWTTVRFRAHWYLPLSLDSLTSIEYIKGKFSSFKVFECEAAMFGRENVSKHCDDEPSILLPGWFETGGNSVLINGRPLNGNIDVLTNPTRLRFTVGRPQEQIVLQAGETVRVTGLVAADVAHGSAPEIHPIYAIDIPQKFEVRRPTADVNLTGVWHGDDIGTYYVRQIGSTVWWLGLSRDQGRSFANVFHGTMSDGTIEGDWVGVPLGVHGAMSDGTLTVSGGPLATELTKISDTGEMAVSNWTKLYDVETFVVPPIGPGPVRPGPVRPGPLAPPPAV